MQFKVDENLPLEIAELLRQAGYGATTVKEDYLQNLTTETLDRFEELFKLINATLPQ